MRFGPFMTVVAIVGALFGLGFLIAPAWVGGFYGEAMAPGEVLIARYLGAALLAIAWIVWSSRGANSAETLHSVLVANAAMQGIAAVIALHGVWTGGINALGWSSVVIHILFCAGFAYFASGKRYTVT